MAKAGFWLRGANGKLAGSTIYKGVDGTIIREVVKPKNPRSSKQLYQRAIIATVMRYYALGKEIFNHSFEGYGVGMPTMRRFQSVNAKRLRALIAADLANGTKNARVVAPGITAAVPNPLIASMGTYTQSFLTHNEQGNIAFPAVVQDETIAAYAQRNGLIEEDIYTIVVIGQSANDMAYEYVTVDGQYVEDASVATTQFNWMQLRVKAGVTTDDTVITANTPITDIFDVEIKSQSIDPENFTIGTGIVFTDLSGSDDYASGAIAIIRSREDSSLRSNSTFDMIGAANKGVTAEWILPVWRAGSNVGNSDLILEGADFSGAGGSVSPALPTTSGDYYVDDTFEQSEVSFPLPIVRFDPVYSSIDLNVSESSDNEYDIVLWSKQNNRAYLGETLSAENAEALASAIANSLSEKYGVQLTSTGVTTVETVTSLDVSGSI